MSPVRRIPIARLCCALTAAIVTLAIWPHALKSALAAPLTSLPDPIPWRQNFFSIPFTISPPTDGTPPPVGVQLYVTDNAGEKWSLASQVDPQQSSFKYRAPRDGEYWFAIRTVDREGHVRGGNWNRPELRVIVDTVPPHLELSAWRTADGQSFVHWVASDPLLNPKSLKVECQTNGDRQWRPIEVNPPRDPQSTTYNGQAAFRSDSTGPILLRAEISDLAGNLATMQTTVRDEAPSPANSASGTAASDNGGATASVQGSPNGPAWPIDHVTNQTVGQATQSSSPAAGASDFVSEPHSNRSTIPDAPGDTADSNRASSNSAPDHGPSFGPTLAGDPSGNNGGTSPPEPTSRFTVAGLATSNVFTQGLPPGERPYMVNSRRFALDYEIESAGGTGATKIEVWGTRDAGRTWQSYGMQSANRSPIKVKVDGEGLYGFRIVVVDSKGVSARPPRSGDLPELWVGVDLTKPLARITATELGSADHAGELEIRYEASDAMLAARPVTLSFTDRAGGPYSTIAAGLENTGSYRWRFDSRVPEQIFLRLEVRDEAGNVGVFETPEPISLDPNRPKGHIRTVHPLDDDSSSRVQQYQFYR
jgi:hypothetical protein